MCILIVGLRKYKSVLAEIGVTRQQNLTPKKKHMYQKLVQWSSKMSSLQRKITSYQERLSSAEKVISSNNFQNIMEYVNGPTYEFILCQIQNQQQHPKSRRYSLDQKLLALSLFKASGKGYRLLSKIFALPSKGSLTKLLNRLPFRAGINQNVFDTLKRSVSKMKPLSKYCSLIFDEIALQSNLQYNLKEDCIDGLEDFGDIQNPVLADHANVFMIKGIFCSWKQPIAFFSQVEEQNHIN